jgi:hypothetical protein
MVAVWLFHRAAKEEPCYNILFDKGDDRGVAVVPGGTCGVAGQPACYLGGSVKENWPLVFVGSGAARLSCSVPLPRKKQESRELFLSLEVIATAAPGPVNLRPLLQLAAHHGVRDTSFKCRP